MSNNPFLNISEEFIAMKMAEEMLHASRTWHKKANCATTKNPLRTEAFNRKLKDAFAKELCADCPVRQKCLEDARGRSQEFGVWGGVWFNGYESKPLLKDK